MEILENKRRDFLSVAHIFLALRANKRRVFLSVFPAISGPKSISDGRRQIPSGEYYFIYIKFIIYSNFILVYGIFRGRNLVS